MHAIPQLKPAAAPWYREPWPWLLMAGPATVIVAGVYTTVLAFRSSDGLVADDYYKQGLAINRTLGREERARALGLGATAAIDRAAGRVSLALDGAQHPPEVLLRLTHPTRAGMDQRVRLVHQGGGRYTGMLDAGALEGRWNAVVETAEWRLAGVWQDPARAPLALVAVR